MPRREGARAWHSPHLIDVYQGHVPVSAAEPPQASVVHQLLKADDACDHKDHKGHHAGADAQHLCVNSVHLVSDTLQTC